MPDFVTKVSFLTKDGARGEGFASEILSPVQLKVFWPGDTQEARYSSIHIVNWDPIVAAWVAE